MKDYHQIEAQNHIKVNVTGYENKQFYPIYRLMAKEYEDEMDLLLMTEEEKKHYVYVKDFNRMTYNKTKHKGKKYFCKGCSTFFFNSEEAIQKHKTVCFRRLMEPKLLGCQNQERIYYRSGIIIGKCRLYL